MTRHPAVRLLVLGMLLLPLGVLRPAYAIHLFPLTPVFDPLGHDCAQNLTAAPTTSAGTIDVVGFTFVDTSSKTSTSTIAAGQSITWKWVADHCHSVTFGSGEGTVGTPGFAPPQPQLVRMSGQGNDAFTMTFPTSGTYAYLCVHHESVGMTGTIVVT